MLIALIAAEQSCSNEMGHTCDQFLALGKKKRESNVVQRELKCEFIVVDDFSHLDVSRDGEPGCGLD